MYIQIILTKKLFLGLINQLCCYLEALFDVGKMGSIHSVSPWTVANSLFRQILKYLHIGIVLSLPGIELCARNAQTDYYIIPAGI